MLIISGACQWHLTRANNGETLFRINENHRWMSASRAQLMIDRYSFLLCSKFNIDTGNWYLCLCVIFARPWTSRKSNFKAKIVAWAISRKQGEVKLRKSLFPCLAPGEIDEGKGRRKIRRISIFRNIHLNRGAHSSEQEHPATLSAVHSRDVPSGFLYFTSYFFSFFIRFLSHRDGKLIQWTSLQWH